MEKRLCEIKARLQATTPGAWEVCFAEDEKFRPDCPEEDPCVCADSGQFIAQTTYDTLSTTCRPTMYADAVFLAHAKDDIAFLLEELDKLRQRPNPIDGFGDIWENPARRTVQAEYDISRWTGEKKGD